MSLTNKTALITGGTKGIGLGIARAMLNEGMKVALTSRSGQSAGRIAEELSAEFPGSVVGLQADTRDRQAQFDSVKSVLDTWGRLDVLIANAGVGHFAHIEDLTVEQWNEVIDVNLTGVFHSCQAAIPSLKESKGYIITIASLAGTNFFANGSAYNASKFGLVGFTQAMMLDLRHEGIKVSTIMPGSVSTYFNSRIPSEADQWKIQPEDLGKMVIDLLKMHPRTLPSKVEVRPSMPPKK